MDIAQNGAPRQIVEIDGHGLGVDDHEIERVRIKRQRIEGAKAHVNVDTTARNRRLRSVRLVGIGYRDGRMTLRSDPVCDRGGKPRIVNADLKGAVPFTHASQRQRRRAAGEPSGEEHRRRITIERRLHHSRVLVPRAYTCPLISMPRNRPVCLAASLAGCAMILAGLPAFTTCGVTPEASTEATGASSNVQLSVLPFSPSTGTSIVM